MLFFLSLYFAVYDFASLCVYVLFCLVLLAVYGLPPILLCYFPGFLFVPSFFFFFVNLFLCLQTSFWRCVNATTPTTTITIMILIEQ